MKLSEAILLGIGVVEEHRTGFLQRQGGDKRPFGCVIGTAVYAIGKGEEYWERHCGSMIDFFYTLWPWTQAMYERKGVTIAEYISHRHYTGESRESIAKWIAPIEPQDTPAVESVGTTESTCEIVSY